jgi:TolB-like protein
MKFFDELKRRNVIKATMAYIVIAWVLMQVLTLILPIFLAPEWVLQTLMILMLVGLPIWMIFSWVYEVTPEGLKKTAQISTDESITLKTNKRLNVIILVVLILAIAVNFIDTSNSQKPSVVANTASMAENSIAVLPFLDMSPNKDQEFYSDGIAVEILNSLCKFKELKVVGRTSSFSFKNTNEDIKSIGSKLNVNNILEGSVQKQQDKIMISVRLTNATDGYTIFSESYSDELGNIFDLQSVIALDIAKKIESKMSLQDNKLYPRRKINPLSYETFLKGKLQFVNGPLNMKPEETFKAKKYFESAVKLDSNFAEANAYLSLVYFNLADWAISGEENLKRDIALDSAKLLAKRAYSLDSLSSGAHLAMGSYYFHEYNWIQAEKEKRQAVALNPGGAEEKFILASFLGQFGQADEALELDLEAMKLDPLDEMAEVKYIRDLFRAKKFEEGILKCNTLIEENRAPAGTYQFLWLCYSGLKQHEKAGKAFSTYAKLLGENELAVFFGENDFKSAVEKMFAYDRVTKSKFLYRPIIKAVFYSYIEDKENTIKYLYETFDNREPTISFLRGSRFDFLKEDPRYIELYEKAGFKAYDEHMKKL